MTRKAEKVTAHFYDRWASVTESFTKNIAVFNVEGIPNMSFRFEDYPEYGRIKFMLFPEGMGWISVFTFDTDKWTVDRMNEAIDGAMKGMFRLLDIYGWR